VSGIYSIKRIYFRKYLTLCDVAVITRENMYFKCFIMLEFIKSIHLTYLTTFRKTHILFVITFSGRDILITCIILQINGLLFVYFIFHNVLIYAGAPFAWYTFDIKFIFSGVLM